MTQAKKIRTFLSLLAGLFLITTSLPAQSSIILEKKFRFSANDRAKSVIQNFEGHLAITGTTKSKKGNDVYLAVLDTAGQVLWKRIVRHTGDDEAHAIVQNMDGTYFIAGNTSTAKGQEAWLLRLNSKGESIQRIKTGKGILHDLTTDIEGNIFATGSINNHLFLGQYDRKGQLLWQSELTDGIGQSLIKSQDGRLIVTGHDANSNSLILLKYDFNAQKVLWQNKIEAAIGMDLVENTNGDIIVCGIHTSNKEDLFLLKVNKAGKEIWRKTEGGRGKDGGLSIIQSLRQEYFVAGYRKPERRAIKFIDGWLHYFNEKGDSLWDDLFLKGEGRSDEFCDLAQLSDGKVATVGWSTSSLIDQKESWLAIIEGEHLINSRNNISLTIPSLPLIMENDLPFISPESRGYYLFNLINHEAQDVHGVTAEVSIKNPPKGLHYFKKLEIGSIKAGELKSIPIPIKGDEKLKNRQFSFDIKIKVDGHLKEHILSSEVEAKESARPVLELSDPVCIGADSHSLEKGSPIVFKIKLANTGTKVAQKIRFKFSLPYKVLPLDDNIEQNIEAIPPGEMKEFSFKFISQDSYLGDSITIGCRVTEQNPDYGLAKKYVYGLGFQEPAIFSGIEKPQKNVFTLNWVNPTYSAQKIITTEPSFLLKTRAYATNPFKKRFIKVAIQTDTISGSKGFDRTIPVKCTFSREEKTALFVADCQCKIELKRGKNQVRFIANNDSIKINSKELNIHFKPNLTVLSIGVPHQDLAYTQKDAKDFAEAYQQQGELFNEITIRTCTKTEETTTQYLRQQFDQLAFDFESGVLRPCDQVIIFVSSHGQDAEDGYGKSFRIHGSDFNEDLNKSTSLNFETDIVDMIKSLKCEKLMFIDACHSGAVADMMDIINSDDNNSNEGFPTILSCRKNELSYEDPKWQNGAFTKATLEAFKNKKVTTEKGMINANSNNDVLLTITELYHFLLLRVPHLVETTKQQPQNPYIQPIYKLNETPIFSFPLMH